MNSPLKDVFSMIPVNLTVTVEIFKALEYFSKYRRYSGLIENSVFAIGGPSFMFDDIQQGSSLQ